MKHQTPAKEFLLLGLLVSLAAASNKVIRLDLERIELPETTRRDTRLLAGAVQISPISNFQNAQYSTTVYVGSARQPLNLLIDTGSALTWLKSPTCPNPS